jgi:hypothetical protein
MGIAATTRESFAPAFCSQSASNCSQTVLLALSICMAEKQRHEISL